jgi:NAD(P)H dehydrogenase (quinone)
MKKIFMKIAITTASGQLGRAIICELKKYTDLSNIIGIARTPEKAEDLGIEIRKADYNDKNAFVKALNGIDIVLIISSNALPNERIVQHINIIEAAKKNDVSKIIYTSIYGKLSTSTFSKIIHSNRQTEQDIKESGLLWAIGRNGLYIDADIDSLEEYKKTGFIINSAGDGKCAYTSRDELAIAYTKLIFDDSLANKTYNLCGEAITQQELAVTFNEIFETKLHYKAISVEDYILNRKSAYGVCFGEIIGGIYQSIAEGNFDIPSDFENVTGRKHLSAKQMFEKLSPFENIISD